MSLFPDTQIPQSNVVQMSKTSWMTFSLQSPGDEQHNNSKTPHSGRDITNLSSFWLLTAGAHRRIFSHSVGQNCLALLSFQLFKRSHKENNEGKKILFLSHYTAEKSP